MDYEHLRFEREPDTTERHRRKDRRPRFKPEDPKRLGSELSGRLGRARRKLEGDLAGYDPRRLLKIRLRDGEPPPDFAAIPGIELVSQEEKTIVLAFATEAGLDEVEKRLSGLTRFGTATRKDLLYAIEDFDHWTPEDRMGPALREHGFPEGQAFVLDIELWPQERAELGKRMVASFRERLIETGCTFLDSLLQPSLVLVRARCARKQAEAMLLRHRDVRTVDLPSRLGVDARTLLTGLQAIPAAPAPSPHAPRLVVLDSGMTTGHPLLGPAVGDAEDFIHRIRKTGEGESNGHGTFVAGLALYGEVGDALEARRFLPDLRIFSGKVFCDDGSDDTRLVEGAVQDAVAYFHEQYGCRIFNISFGDLNKVYDERHLRGLAYTLDRLSRALGILFVTSAGNVRLVDLPEDPIERYPDYLFARTSRILDPGTALNAITVGGLARHEASRGAQRHPDHLEAVPVARHDQPSPITRCGPSIGSAIKPDFVEHAGNVAIARHGRPCTAGLGVVSFNSGFATGSLFCEDIGTSYAAPLVARKAARLNAELPEASPSLIRALLGAHANWPASCERSLNPGADRHGRNRLLRSVGYGRIDERALYRSLGVTVSLIAEDVIACDCHHFYEVPIPESFWTGSRRQRWLTVALAFAPEVRTTRLSYRATRLRFSVVNAESLEEVTTAFRRNRDNPMSERNANRWLSGEKRNAGTLQVSRWTFSGKIRKRRLFVVVTRQDETWSPVREESEAYALCAVVDDHELAGANLYADVRAVLQARARIRLRA